MAFDFTALRACGRRKTKQQRLAFYAGTLPHACVSSEGSFGWSRAALFCWLGWAYVADLIDRKKENRKDNERKDRCIHDVHHVHELVQIGVHVHVPCMA